jgi:hypothetical protein
LFFQTAVGPVKPLKVNKFIAYKIRMPLIPTTSSSDLLYIKEGRMLYAHRILKEQSFTQGNTNRIDLVSGNAGVNSSSATLPMKVGAHFVTPEERAIILGESQPTVPAPDPIVTLNPVASYLPTNGTVSTWTDTVGTLNATMTGSPTYSPSLGYTFNGSTQYGRIASSTGINNFNNTDSYSVEIWLNPSSGQPSASLATVLEKWNSTNQSRYPYVFRYIENSTSIDIAAYDGTRFPKINISGVATNTWVQVVGVFNFTTDIITAYKNGSSAGTVSLTNVGSVANTSRVAIGHRISTNGTSAEILFKGSIGMIRFYNTALSTEEVSQLFTNARSTFGI